MTLEEIKALDKPYLIAADIAGLMERNPQTIRELARADELPFRAECSGSRVRIPRLAFIRYWEEMCGC